MSNIRNEIKVLLIHSNISMTGLVDLLNHKYNRNDTVQNLNNKLARGTIQYYEIKEIAEILEYDLAWIPKDYQLQAGSDGLFYSPQLDDPSGILKRPQKKRKAIKRNIDK